MMTLPGTDIITPIVSRIFKIEEVTLGDTKPRAETGSASQGYFLRYRGELTRDSVEAYDLLAAALLPYDITPLFRVEDERQTILLIRGTIHPKPGRPLINVALFLLTLLSVMLVGTMYSFSGQLPCDFWGQMKILSLNIWQGWPFAVSLLTILLAHEFGHYFVGRARGAEVSLPYFIPFPFSILGTMGAFIQLKSLPKNKRALFDLGIAGPLAGLVVAIPVLALGLALSKVEPLTNTYYLKATGQCEICTNTAVPGDTYSCPDDNLLEGNSLLYLGMKFLVKGQLLPAPASYAVSPLVYWFRYLLTGHPIPLGGQDVMLHPVAWAGWAGLLVTFLNLIPAGQLDGGHVLYALFGRRVGKVFPVILVATLLLGFIWSGWWFWSFLFFLMGRSHAEPLDQITRIDSRRKILAAMVLVIFLFVLTPVPYVTF
jgi:membrane-associated protease RseP (regulator of RpoE activity)